MERENPSLSDILTDSTSKESIPESVEPKEEFFDDGGKAFGVDYDSNDHDLILDLRNVPAICDVKTDDDKSEKLSEVIEESEDVAIVTETQSYDKCEESRKLQERISSLQSLMITLRDELMREVALWRKEREEFQVLRERSDLLALEEATAAARAAAEAYAAESPLSEGLGDLIDVNPEQTLSELTILEYEKKLAKYQDALALAQAEKRYNMRRQLAANTYRQKLIEVERLCDEELEKIKQNANSLQPLRKIASQWYRNDRSSGDSNQQICQLDPHYKSAARFPKGFQSNVSDFQNFENADAEVNLVPEIFVGKFNMDEYSMGGTENLPIWREIDTSDQIGNIPPGINWYTSQLNS